MVPNARRHSRDRQDKTRKKQPCARCGKVFQPTLMRRILCMTCYLKPEPSFAHVAPNEPGPGRGQNKPKDLRHLLPRVRLGHKRSWIKRD